MSDFGFNVWGALASAAGILFALYPAFKAWVRPRLPTSLLPDVLEMHKECQELLATALREGLLIDHDDFYLYNKNMVIASIRVDEVRAQVYAIKSWRQDVGQWWSGLSGTVKLLGQELNAFRLSLAECNSRSRKLLASQGLLLGERSLLTQDSKRDSSNIGSMTTVPTMPPRELPKGSYHWAMAIPYSVYPGYHPLADQPESTLPEATPQDDSSGSSAHEVPAAPTNQARHVSGSTADLSDQLITKADLSSLLELALSKSHHCPHRSKSCRSAKNLPVRSCNHGRGRTGRTPAGSGRKPSKGDALHTRLEGLERLVRRLYGLRTRSRVADMSSKHEVDLDPEALTPVGVVDSDTDGESDDWIEECQ